MMRPANTDDYPVLAAAWQAGVEGALRANHMERTPPRCAIVRWIAEVQASFTAEALVVALESHGGSSRATIYRFLDWLHDHHWIGRVYSNPGRKAYTRLLPGQCQYAVCVACGNTAFIEQAALGDALASALEQTEFSPQGYVLEVYGLCTRCRPAHQTAES